MSPRRGDRVTVPPPQDQWNVRFGTSDAADGWEELCRHALGERPAIPGDPPGPDPRSGGGHDRQHRLRGNLATHRHNGRDMEQWEHEVTSGGRVRYVIDAGSRRCRGRRRGAGRVRAGQVADEQPGPRNGSEPTSSCSSRLARMAADGLSLVTSCWPAARQAHQVLDRSCCSIASVTAAARTRCPLMLRDLKVSKRLYSRAIEPSGFKPNRRNSSASSPRPCLASSPGN